MDNKVLYFEPKGVVNAYFRVGWTLFLGGVAIYGVIDWFPTMKKVEIIFMFSIVLGYFIFMAYIYILMFTTSKYVILTDEYILGKNDFKRESKRMNYDEIVEIRGRKGSFIVRLISKDNKILKIQAEEYSEELFNTLIPRLTNLEKLDLRYIRKESYPNIIMYEKF